jgi:SNF family Na+-dependent transporter
VLDILDHAFGTVGILLAALLTALMFSWYVDRQFLEDEISCGCRRFVLPLVKYIVPVVLATVLLFTLLPI